MNQIHRFTTYAWCPSCKDTTWFAHGPVVDGAEQRRCGECSAVLPSVAYEVCPLKEGRR